MNHKDRNRTDPMNAVLYETTGFRLSILIPYTISIFFFVAIYIENEVVFSFSRHDLNNLFDFFKLPIYILGLSVPLTALSAAVHRSEQTALQLSAQTEQNNFANHFKHLEEFKRTFSSKENHLVFWKSSERLHRCIYPNTRAGNLFPIDTEAVNKDSIKSILMNDNDDLTNVLENIDHAVREMLKHYCADRGTKPKMTRKYSYYDLQTIATVIDNAFTFSGMHDAPFSLTNEKWLDEVSLASFTYTQIQEQRTNLVVKLRENGKSIHFRAAFSEFDIPEAMHLKALKYFCRSLSHEELDLINKSVDAIFDQGSIYCLPDPE